MSVAYVTINTHDSCPAELMSSSEGKDKSWTLQQWFDASAPWQDTCKILFVVIVNLHTGVYVGFMGSTMVTASTHRVPDSLFAWPDTTWTTCGKFVLGYCSCCTARHKTVQDSTSKQTEMKPPYHTNQKYERLLSYLTEIGIKEFLNLLSLQWSVNLLPDGSCLNCECTTCGRSDKIQRQPAACGLQRWGIFDAWLLRFWALLWMTKRWFLSHWIKFPVSAKWKMKRRLRWFSSCFLSEFERKSMFFRCISNSIAATCMDVSEIEVHHL